MLVFVLLVVPGPEPVELLQELVVAAAVGP